MVKKKWDIEFCGKQHLGLKRTNQEDEFLTPWELQEFGIPISQNHFVEKGILLAIADGMQGEGYGKVASQNALYAVAKEYHNFLKHPKEPFKFLREALKEAYIAIREKIEGVPKLEGMGTTLTMALLLDGAVYTCHIGDSRIYHISRSETDEETITQQSEDHSEPSERHVLKQAVGLSWMPPRELAGTEPSTKTLQPDIRSFTITPGDSLVLCSDGLWSMVDDEEIKAIVSSSTSPLQACVKLISAANQRGGDDNISVIVLMTEKKSQKSLVLLRRWNIEIKPLGERLTILEKKGEQGETSFIQFEPTPEKWHRKCSENCVVLANTLREPPRRKLKEVNFPSDIKKILYQELQKEWDKLEVEIEGWSLGVSNEAGKAILNRQKFEGIAFGQSLEETFFEIYPKLQAADFPAESFLASEQTLRISIPKRQRKSRIYEFATVLFAKAKPYIRKLL